MMRDWILLSLLAKNENVCEFFEQKQWLMLIYFLQMLPNMIWLFLLGDDEHMHSISMIKII
jgi:hypothetical protein